MDHLPVIPRVGESFHINFLKAYLNSTLFYVDKIDYEIVDTIQVVDIYLKGGFYNLFWHWRKDKAGLTREVSGMDFISLDDWELQRKIKLDG